MELLLTRETRTKTSTIGSLSVNGALSATDRQKLEGYLIWHSTLQATLPANHPYKNAAP